MDKKELEHRLDRLCSTFVRCREHRCYTCNRLLDYKHREAGHYIPREVKACRWDLQNIHVQCHKCNVFLDGNHYRYQELMLHRDPHYVKQFDWMLELYKRGNLPEPTYDQKVLMYNNMLDMVQEQYPQAGAYSFEWQKIE